MRARLSVEPGRAVVAQAAVALYTVGTIKHLPGIRTYVAVDGGMSDNPRPVLYGSGYEVFLPRAANAERPREVTVVGKHCESGDIVVPEGRVPQDLPVGDVLAVPGGRRLRLLHGLQLQQGAAPGSGLRPRRRRPRGRPPRDLRRPPPPRPVGASTAGARARDRCRLGGRTQA